MSQTISGTYTNTVTLTSQYTTLTSTARLVTGPNVDIALVGTLTPLAGLSVTNYGTIIGTNYETVVFDTSSTTAMAGTIVNEGGGLIEGSGGYGVLSYGDTDVDNEAGGTITGTFYAIGIEGVAETVSNAGLVEGSSAAILEIGTLVTAPFLSVLNRTGGTIEGIDGGYGIYLETGEQSVANEAGGTISGGVVLDSGGTVTNAGTISGNSNNAIEFDGTSAARLILDPGAVVDGAIVGQTRAGTTDTLELAQGTAADTGTLSTFGTQFSNFGTIVVDPGASWYFAPSNTIATNVTLTDAGTLTNQGSIGSTVTLLSGAGTFTNTGNVVTTAKFGVYEASGAGTVTNAGTISGLLHGVELQHGGTVTNTGSATILGQQGNGVVVNGSAGAVTNAGLISGDSDGVYLQFGGTVSNTGSATIVGQHLYGIDAYGSAGTVTNVGMIQGGRDGVHLRKGGSVANTGTASAITGGRYGVYIVGNLGTVTNEGTISAGVYGVYLKAGGAVTNVGAASCISSIQYGVYGEGTNGVYIKGAAGTVTNAGTIAGAVEAVHFSGAYADRLILDPGAVLQGAVVGQTGTVATNTLELAGTAGQVGTLTGFDTQFSNFGTVVVDAGATWVLDATDAIGAGVTLVNQGTVASTVTLAGGTLINSGTVETSGNAAVYAPDAATVLNTGTLSGADEGVFLKDGGTVTNTGTASLIDGTSLNGVVVAGGAGTVSNAGTISGGSSGYAGIFLDDGGTVTNVGTAGLIVDTGRYGVDVYGGAGLVSNAGTILGAAVGVYLQDGGTVTNSGTASLIAGTSAYGVNIEGGAGTVVNTGTVTGYYAGVRLTAGGTVDNSGTIISIGTTTGTGIYVSGAGMVSNAGGVSGGSTGVYLAGSGTVSNTGTASAIAGGYDGVVIGQAGTVVNEGTISGTDRYGVELVSGGSVSNTGTVLGGADGVRLNGVGSISNGGTITGYHAGIHLTAGGTVDNFGTIIGIATDAGTGIDISGAGTVSNAGEVSGGFTGVSLGGGTATVTNAGTIAGGIYAVQFVGTYADRLILDAGAVETGALVGQAGTLGTTVLELAAGAASAGTLANAISNVGTIAVDAGADWVFGAANSIGAGVLLTDAGTLTNAGSIGSTVTLLANAAPFTNTATGTISITTARTGGVEDKAGTGTVVNAGTILGDNQGVYLALGGTLFNTGTAAFIGAPASDAVLVTGGAGTVTNSGGILSGGTGGNGVKLTAGGSVTNSADGLVEGGQYGVYVAGSAGTVINSGTLSGGTSRDGVRMTAGGSVTNSAGGLVEGGLIGVYATGTAGTVTNSAGGLIRGGLDGVLLNAGGTITNAGTILAVNGFEGVRFGTAPGTLINSGTVAAESFGVGLNGGGVVINTGTISTSGTSGAAVFLGGGDATVTNAGTIAGMDDAVSFVGTYDGRLILDAGAVETGALMGSTAAGATDTLELAAGAASAGTLASAITNFGTIAVDPDTSWTLAGAGQTIAAGVSLGSTLTVASSGTAAFAGALYGAGGLAIDGPAGTDLLAANGFSGGVALGAGTLVVGNDAALGTGTLSMAQGTTLAFSGNLTLGNTIALAGDPTVALMAGQVEVLTGPITDAVGQPAGVLDETGGGTLVLSGPNSFSGGTALDGGTLELAAQGAAGTASGGETAGGVDYAAAGTTLRIDGAAFAESGTTGSYAAPVTDFAAGDALDLPDLGYASGTTISYDDDVLTVANANGTRTLDDFTLANGALPAGDVLGTLEDATGGTEVTVVGDPTLTGLADSTTDLQAPTQPFAGASVADPTAGATDSVTIALAGAAGTLAGSGLATNPDGTYTLGAASPTTLSGELDALVFTPAPADGGPVETTAFDLTVASSTGASASASVSSTIDSNPNMDLFGAVTHDVTSPGGDVYALYQTILGRAPDPVGDEGWVQALDDGTPIASIAQSFLASSEYANDYGATVSSDSGFVDQLYEDGLHRAPEPAGLAYWDNMLANGTSRAQVAVDIATSPEAQSDLGPTFQAGVFVPDASDSAVARLYYGLLNRAPDATGFENNAAGAQNGESLGQSIETFLGSPEYAATPVGQDALAYVNYYYENALGRAGDPSQVAAYQTALDTGAASPAGVADTFFASQEFQSDEAGQSNAAYIDKVYQVALGRDPEPAGYAAWEAALAQGASRVGVAEGIVASSEFAEKVTQPMEAAFVTALYEGALGRAPSSSEVQGWQSAFANGASVPSVAAGIVESQEATLHLAPRIEAGYHIA